MSRELQRDESGVEFAVESGYGTIDKIVWPIEGKKNAEVFFDAEGLRLPVRGWANTERADLAQVLKDAETAKARVAFRIETHRNDKQPKDIPLDDVPKMERFRRLEGLRIAGGAQGPDTPAAPSVPIPDVDGWSYAVGMVDLAYELLHAATADGRLKAVLPSQVGALASVLLRTADAAQEAVMGQSDRLAGSHTRARGAVRSALRSTPPPLGADLFAIEAWAAKLGRVSSLLLSQAAALAAETPAVDDAVAVLSASWA